MSQAQTSAGDCGPQEGWTRAQRVTDKPVLHLCALLWYLGSNLARGLLTILWRNQTMTVGHSPPGSAGQGPGLSAKFLLAKHKNTEQIPSVLSGKNSQRIEFPLPLAYWESLFPTAQSLGSLMSEGTVMLG